MSFVSRQGVMAALFLVVGLSLLPTLAAAQTGAVYAVSSTNQLLRFNVATPGTVATIGTIGGLQAGENVLGIDFRPATGQLYALGSSSRIYTVNLITAQATAVGSAGSFTLNGTEFGFDFNPTVDRIRVVSNTGQNLRLNPVTGALAAIDGPLNPGVPNVSAAAYTNNTSTATTTILYDIDITLDSLFIQNPPNNGTLTVVGPLGVDSSGTNGFDISPTNGTAYAALTVGGLARLYTINLGSGAATLVGTIGSGGSLRGLAIPFGAGVNATSVLDFDGDRRTDYSVLRLTENNWYVHRSSNNSFFAVPFGLAQSDIMTPADYDGDGRADIAVWRPSNGVFYVLQSSNGTVRYYQFGINGDEPVARDYDGDGRADFAVVRRSGGVNVWYVNNSANNTFRYETFGFGTDIVTPGDFDGDGKFDLGVRRAASSTSPATFYLQQSTAGFAAIQFGVGGDLVVPGDYDGDGRTDLTALRAGSQYTWYIRFSSSGALWNTQLGAKPHIPTQGDYDGDGKTNVSVWDPIGGVYYVLGPNGVSVSGFAWGANGDVPVASFDTH